MMHVQYVCQLNIQQTNTIEQATTDKIMNIFTETKPQLVYHWFICNCPQVKAKKLQVQLFLPDEFQS